MDKNRAKHEYIEEDEINYNVYKVNPSNEQAMRQTMVLLRDELIELIKTYLDPWCK